MTALHTKKKNPYPFLNLLTVEVALGWIGKSRRRPLCRGFCVRICRK